MKVLYYANDGNAARKTNQLTAVLGALALACGGEERVRLADDSV